MSSEARDLQLSGEKCYYVYIMASRSLNLCVGVTTVFTSVPQHKAGEIDGFTRRYHINRLVYYESFKYVRDAIVREKRIKGWSRAKKLALVKSMNPTSQDLAEDWAKPIEPLKLRIPRFARDDKTVDRSGRLQTGPAKPTTDDQRPTTASR